MTNDVTTLHQGKHLRMRRRGSWEFAERCTASGVVTIVPVTVDDQLLFTEQFRSPVGKPVIEFPAGLAGDIRGAEQESLMGAARRELLEETGYEADG